METSTSGLTVTFRSGCCGCRRRLRLLELKIQFPFLVTSYFKRLKHPNSVVMFFTEPQPFTNVLPVIPPGSSSVETSCMLVLMSMCQSNLLPIESNHFIYIGIVAPAHQLCDSETFTLHTPPECFTSVWSSRFAATKLNCFLFVCFCGLKSALGVLF